MTTLQDEEITVHVKRHYTVTVTILVLLSV